LPELLTFDREAPCPACGIALEIRGVCDQPHRDLDTDAGRVRRLVHLDVACPGCGWSGYMRTAIGTDGPALDAEDVPPR
jgi:hypothetical protein